MSRTWFVVGVLLAVAGAVWMLQGFNARFAPRSFMTNNRIWILYGAISVVGGLSLVAWSRR